MASQRVAMAEQFRTAMHRAGLEPPSAIIPDGNLHRYYVPGDKPGTLNGWYVLHSVGATGLFGCWKRGINEFWHLCGDDAITPGQKATHRANMEALRKKQTEERDRLHARCRKQSAGIFCNAPPAPPEHPYLQRKGIKPHGVRISGKSLVIPVAVNGTLTGLQFIRPDGSKQFMAGTEISGGYFCIGTPQVKTVIICEGFATGASLHEASGHAVAVAFNAGNLLPVAVALRAKYPEYRLVICADDDHGNEVNTGLEKGAEATRKINGLLVVPTFRDESARGTDFNDLHQAEGLEAVDAVLEAAGVVHV